MKYVLCTQKHPLALYDQETLNELGSSTINTLQLLERTDSIHFLSYVAPHMSRGEYMKEENLSNMLLISGFEQPLGCSLFKTEQDILTINGVLPSKAYVPLPIDITIKRNQTSSTSTYCIQTVRFQIIDTNKFI